MKSYRRLFHAAMFLSVLALSGCGESQVEQGEGEAVAQAGEALTGQEAVDQQQTSWSGGLLDVNNTAVAQVFTAGVTGYLTHFSHAAYPCTVHCDFTLELHAIDGSGNPGALLWSGRGTQPLQAGPGGSYGWTTTALANPPTVNAGARYAITILPDSWEDFALGDGYAAGYALAWSAGSSAWNRTANGDDLLFQTWVTPFVDPLPGVTYAFRTPAGGYLSMVYGGGLGGPNSGPGSVALHTDATAIGPWEEFTWVWVDQSTGKFALKTVNGNTVTAVNGGNMGGPNDATSPVHTDAGGPYSWESLKVVPLADGKVAIQTASGNYLTAVNGGGYGGPNNVPIHTDATWIGAWETFTLVKP
jgi:hypothetical protein